LFKNETDENPEHTGRSGSVSRSDCLRRPFPHRAAHSRLDPASAWELRCLGAEWNLRALEQRAGEPGNTFAVNRLRNGGIGRRPKFYSTAVA
jgi:hypothetical protein